MKNLLRYLFFTLIGALLLYGVADDALLPLHKADLEKTGYELSCKNTKSKSEQYIFSAPVYHGENELAPQGHSPSIVTGKNLLKDNTTSGILVAEATIENIAYHYFSHSKKIQVGLSIQDLIFPFHYFF